jgi:transposase InsO family protein
VKYACIEEHTGAFTVVLMCRVLSVSRPGYYAWRCRRPSQRAQSDTQLRVAIRAIHAASQQRYGRPRIHQSLRAQDWRCSQKRVGRLMRLEGLRGKRARRYRRTTHSDGTLPAPNRLQRCFQVARPNRVWVSDVTACWTAEGWLYVAVVLDLASRRIIGWAAGRTVGQELTIPALQLALRLRQPLGGLLHHSDRGMHYTGTSYQRLLRAHGIEPSMSRRGDCWDNAVAESFFATLKTELVVDAQWRSRAEALSALRHYLDWYNNQRLHSTLNYLSPVVFERQLSAA